MSRGNIAIIDDDPLQMGYYIRALEDAGYKVHHFRSPASCKTALLKGALFDLFLCDLMMPPRGSYKIEDSEDGLITGLLFTEELRERDSDTPIFLFTNLNIQTVVSRVAQRLENLVNVFLLPKAQFTPDRMCEAIPAMLEQSLPPLQRKGILKRLFDSLILEPNFFGMGVNLKKIADGSDKA